MASFTSFIDNELLQPKLLIKVDNDRVISIDIQVTNHNGKTFTKNIDIARLKGSIQKKEHVKIVKASNVFKRHDKPSSLFVYYHCVIKMNQISLFSV